MSKAKKSLPGILLCLCIALLCWLAGQKFPLIGGPVFAILTGMIIALFYKKRTVTQAGIQFTSKKILQLAVILLGFGLNLSEVLRVGALSLPIILATISTALLTAFVLCKLLKIPSRIATLVGVGSSICGGSAIAAAAPVINANDEEIAQSISVIFFFNVIAALLFPSLGNLLGLTDAGFGLFAGTAINDTSSVTAAATAWDGMHPGANTLDTATIVKLTRTLAIIPITLFLAFYGVWKARNAPEKEKNTFPLRRVFPVFILFFLLASVITTICVSAGVDASLFQPWKELSKFFIIMAMAAVGLNTDLIKIVKTGGKAIFTGACCWVMISIVSLLMQNILKLW